MMKMPSDGHNRPRSNVHDAKMIPSGPDAEGDGGPQGDGTDGFSREMVPVGLESRLEQVLEPLLDKPKLGIVVRKVEQIVSSEIFAGPLPHPRHLREYKEIEPTAPDRIMKMAESEQDFRHRIMERALNLDAAAHFTGLILGFLITLILVGVAAYLAINGLPGYAMGFIGASALGLVPIFVHSAQNKKNKDAPPDLNDSEVSPSGQKKLTNRNEKQPPAKARQPRKPRR